MSYSISFSNKNKTPILVNDDTVDNKSTDITLFGRSELEYGQTLQENLLHILEHFAVQQSENSNISPDIEQTIDGLLANPIDGQLWYNKTDDTLYFYSSGLWTPISKSEDLAANWGVIGHGEQIPLPISPSNIPFNYSDCVWIVSPFNYPKNTSTLNCQTDDQANVTMEYVYTSDETSHTGFVNYFIVAIRGNTNYVAPPVSLTPTPTISVTITPSIGASPTPTSTSTPSPTVTPTHTTTKTPSVTPTRSPFASPAPTPSHTPTTSKAPAISSFTASTTCVQGGCSNNQPNTNPCTAYTNSGTATIVGGNGNYTFGYNTISGNADVTLFTTVTSNGNGTYKVSFHFARNHNCNSAGGAPQCGKVDCNGNAGDCGTISYGWIESDVQIWAKDYLGHIATTGTIRVITTHTNAV